MSEILTEIGKGKNEKNYWKDLWRYRELFFILSWRDLKVRYKQTFIGAAWSIVRPLLTTIILSFVFSRIANISNNSKIPYLLIVYVAMLPWQFFSVGLSEASNSLVGNINLITKVYFPRIIIPISTIITNLVDLLISLVILVILMWFYKIDVQFTILFLPLLILLTVFLTTGIGLYLTSLNVKYRDFRYIIPFIIQIGLYITPIGFVTDIVPEKYKLLYYFNPLVGLIDLFRWSLLGSTFNTISFLISTFEIFLILLIGIFYFRSMEKSFADNI